MNRLKDFDVAALGVLSVLGIIVVAVALYLLVGWLLAVVVGVFGGHITFYQGAAILFVLAVVTRMLRR